MNTYLLPIYEEEEVGYPEIISVKAINLASAEDKFLNKISSLLDDPDDFPESWNDINTYLYKYDFIVGEISDIEEF